MASLVEKMKLKISPELQGIFSRSGLRSIGQRALVGGKEQVSSLLSKTPEAQSAGQQVALSFFRDNLPILLIGGLLFFFFIRRK